MTTPYDIQAVNVAADIVDSWDDHGDGLQDLMERIESALLDAYNAGAVAGMKHMRRQAR